MPRGNRSRTVQNRSAQHGGRSNGVLRRCVASGTAGRAADPGGTGRTGPSLRGHSDLERGVNRTPRRQTIQALEAALQLSSAAPPPGVPPLGKKTFLIADIRGYTSYTVEHGNDADAELAMRFARLARAAIGARSRIEREKRRGGRVPWRLHLRLEQSITCV